MTKVIIIGIMSLISLSCGCLMINEFCPRGRRNKADLGILEVTSKPCLSCKHGKDEGRCFGPHICCGPSFGCLIETPETHVCHNMSLNSDPCVAGFANCQNNTGRCAARHVCCSEESCSVDASCKLSNHTSDDNASHY